MRWVHAALPLASVCLAYVFGSWLGGRGRRAAWWAIGATLPLLLIRWATRAHPETARFFFPFRWYGILHVWWAYPVAYFFLALPGSRVAGRVTRGLAHICLMLITVTVGVRSAGEFRVNPRELTGRPNEWGLCAQTTTYSCGASAAATLLGLHDIPSSEREMAVFCGTNPLLGTDPVSVQYGLRRKLAPLGCDARILRCDWRELREMPMPAMVLVKYAGLVDHWTVLLEANEKTVTVADSQCVVELPTGVFLDEWRGLAIFIERTQPWGLLRYRRAAHGLRAA